MKSLLQLCLSDPELGCHSDVSLSSATIFGIILRGGGLPVVDLNICPDVVIPGVQYQ